MATTTCPNCGKPLRPGAKFCGHCGATLPAVAPPSATGQQAAPPAATPSGALCPHCGKPVRPGAKFCSNCGKTIESTGEIPRPAAVPSARSPVAGAAMGATGEQPRQKSAGAIPAVPPAAKPTQRKGIPVLVLAILVAGCGVAAVAGYFAANRLGFLGKRTPSAAVTTTVALSETESPIPSDTSAPTSTELPVSSPTQETQPPTPTATATIETVTQPAATQPLLVEPPTTTQTISPTVALTSTSPALPLPATTLLFEDTFDQDLATNWRTWGSQRPTIDIGPGDRWLSLKAEVPTSAGATTRRDLPIVLEFGAVIEFEAQLNNRFPRYVLVFDWDPERMNRGPELLEPGVIHLEIRQEQLRLQTPITGEDCTQPINALEKHLYRLQVTSNQGLELYLNDNPAPICQITSIGLGPLPGSITFSGLGWVTRVKILAPVKP